MNSRKFFVLFCVLYLLLISSGCGGGNGEYVATTTSGDITPISGDIASRDNTPAPSPSPTPETPPTIDPEPSGAITITFETFGGTEIAPIFLDEPAAIDSPDVPVSGDNLFGGWYVDNTFAEPFTFGVDVVSRDITLYALWVAHEPDAAGVDIAASEIVIGYAQGDNPGYVTQNLSLPADADGAHISWTSSNRNIITNSGTVLRPSGSDAEVTLTAEITSGDFVSTKDFSLTVIRARSISIEDAKILTVSCDADDIMLMNEENDDFAITYSSGDIEVIRAVEGQFTTVTVNNADDALDAVQSVHEALGINDPYDELELLTVDRHDDGAQYIFRQVCKYEDYSGRTADSDAETVEVYGRTLMVSANSEGQTDFLTSNVITSDKLNDLLPATSPEGAERTALTNYPDNSGLEVDRSQTTKIIYALKDYYDDPVFAYKVRVTGTVDGDFVDDTVIVDGVELAVVDVIPNVRTYSVNKNGRDELGEIKTFPVNLVFFPPRFTMRDSGTPEVIVFSGDTKYIVQRSLTASWTDGHQISAYTNMRTVIKWWKEYFNRNSLDNKGMIVKVVTHERIENWRDNAFWWTGNNAINICDSSYNGTYEYSGAMGLDTLTHESTHAVMHYTTGGIPYRNATGAIDEAYADIFGALRDEDWKHGWRADDDSNDETGITYFVDKTRCRRDLRRSTSVNDLSSGNLADVPALYEHYRTVTPTNGNDHNGVHTYSRLIAHAAYLMHMNGASSPNGLTWPELRRVWYRSLFMGLDATSDFHTVRRNVIRAAQQCGLSASKIIVIKRAFDGVGIYAPKGTLMGRVTDYDDGTISGGATVLLRNNSGLVEFKTTIDNDGYFVLSADAGNYTATVAPTFGSYRTLTNRIYIAPDRTETMNAELVKTGTGSLNIKIRNTGSTLINGVTLELFSGWNSYTSRQSSGTTNNDGEYTFSNIPSGYYTVRISKSGYDNSILNVTVAPDETVSRYRTIYERSKYIYTAIVVWRGNRTYIDPHLKARFVASGMNIHVDEENWTANAPNGREASHVYSFPVIGMKSITFTKFTNTAYTFYVKWDDPSNAGWNGAGLKVWLYYNDKYITVYTPPEGASTGQYWEVFRINSSGARVKVNEISAEEPNL